MSFKQIVCVFAFLLINASPVFAGIVDVSANWEYWRYNYSPLPFAAGTYKITPVGIANGGQYDAWNAWGPGEITECDETGQCLRGYINSYSFGFVGENSYVTEIATVGGSVVDGTALAYQSPLLALTNAESYVFSLAQAEKLYFYLRDGENWYHDNAGGMSLSIQKIPEPSTWYLILFGLLSLIATSSVSLLRSQWLHQSQAERPKWSR